MNPCRRGRDGGGGGRGVEGDMSQVPQANSSTIINIYSHFTLVTDKKLWILFRIPLEVMMVFPRSYFVYSVNYFLTLSSGFPLRVGWLLTINPRLPCIIYYIQCYIWIMSETLYAYRSWDGNTGGYKWVEDACTQTSINPNLEMETECLPK